VSASGYVYPRERSPHSRRPPPSLGCWKNAVTSRNRAAVARAKGRLRGKQPKLSAKQQTELRRMHTTGDYSIADLAELFNIGRATVYRTLRRQATSES
jgi:Helix-turn-helix domain of resolvase